MSLLVFDRAVCQNFEEACRREWLETNSRGGFASSTICGANTRRYHGLLVAALPAPQVRCVLLSKLEETVIAGGQRFELSTNFYPGVTHPQGYRSLVEFRLDPFPVFTFHAGGVTLEKRIHMVQAENTVVVDYQLLEGPACVLELRPLIAFRGYHDLTHANGALNPALNESGGAFSIQPYDGLPRVFFTHNARSLTREGEWYFNFEYTLEHERGLDFREDLFCPCSLAFDLPAAENASIIASTEVQARRDRPAPPADIFARAADQFCVRRDSIHTIIAGYPWFTDWGRDTMIALPGLTLATGRFDTAREILLAFAGMVNQGMLPNRFPDTGTAPEYNTVDGTLWFFEAVRQYLELTGDTEFLRVTGMSGKLNEIIQAHIGGTRFGIHMDSGGLITAGDPATNLTWMDARVNGIPVTPRHGKAVEIQALWYNALRVTASLNADAELTALAAKTGQSFNALFWNEAAGCLFDVENDPSIRPNQVIALSLGYCAIPADRARRILAVVERELLTPFGLRTLAPSDPRYRGRYQGPPE